MKTCSTLKVFCRAASERVRRLRSPFISTRRLGWRGGGGLAGACQESGSEIRGRRNHGRWVWTRRKGGVLERRGRSRSSAASQDPRRHRWRLIQADVAAAWRRSETERRSREEGEQRFIPRVFVATRSRETDQSLFSSNHLSHYPSIHPCLHPSSLVIPSLLLL